MTHYFYFSDKSLFSSVLRFPYKVINLIVLIVWLTVTNFAEYVSVWLCSIPKKSTIHFLTLKDCILPLLLLIFILSLTIDLLIDH